MTYYRIMKYLTDKGLTAAQANYVRNMIRELVHESSNKVKIVGHHRFSHDGACEPNCYYETTV